MKSTMLFLFGVLLLLAYQSPAQSIKQGYFISQEDQLQDPEYAARIDSLYQHGPEGTFQGQEGIAIYYKVFLHEQANSPAIVISSGRTEAAIKYQELIFDLFNNGYSVYILDHRGQGQSGRILEDPELGYVADFQHYIDDMKLFFDSCIRANQHAKTFLLAHSMGGAIGMTYLQQFPEDFTAAAFSSPMLGLPIGLCTGAKLLEPDEPRYGLGEGPYDEDLDSFDGNSLTNSELRYGRMIAAYQAVPEARLGGASYQWVVKSCRQFDYMLEHIANLQTPFILFSAEEESIVSSTDHHAFVKAAHELGKAAQIHNIAEAKHELLIEQDPARTETMQRFLLFFERY